MLNDQLISSNHTIVRQHCPNKSKTIFETYNGCHNNNEEKKLGSRWRIALQQCLLLMKSALVPFSRPQNSMRHQDPKKKTSPYERTTSPKTILSTNVVGCCWRREIIEVKGQILPFWSIFALQ